MKKLSLKNKIVTVILTGGVLLSCSGFALAVGNSVATSIKLAVSKVQLKLPMNKPFCGNRKEVLEITLKESVNSNLITQGESDKITAYFTSLQDENNNNRVQNPQSNTPRTDPFKELVNKGIITQQKSDAIKASMKNKITAIKKEKMQKGLNELVNNKTLNREQANKIEEAILNKNMDPLKALVDNKTITEKQANEVRKSLHSMRHGKN